MAGPQQQTRPDLSALRAEIARLEAMRRQLDGTLAEVDHRARRLGDGLERAGWRSPDIERELGVLARNRDRTGADLADLCARIAALKARLAALDPGGV